MLWSLVGLCKKNKRARADQMIAGSGRNADWTRGKSELHRARVVRNADCPGKQDKESAAENKPPLMVGLNVFGLPSCG